MSAEARIDALTAADLPAVGALFEAHTGRPAALDTLGRWLSSAPAVAARAGDGLAGYLVCKPFAPDIAELAAVLVAPPWRGRGLGSRLVRAAEDRCAGSGMRAIVVVTSSAYPVRGEKRSSRAFYERLGYEVILRTAATSVLGHHLDGDL